ncbi:MAG: glutamate-5-semialdehyde dehydrogenase [Tannerella sp.]|jgi:glutamate-5-semialdehyde dehydrogenase|nr:glutamate-5-semialdehyde dehydrogenase [Tannerella sp.]
MNTVKKQIRQAAEASLDLRECSDAQLSRVLTDAADKLSARQTEILEANRRDLAHMKPDDPKYDRLTLTATRLNEMADGMKQVARLPSPLGKTLAEDIRPNGMRITKISVPFGVIGIIYESRPNVTVDVFSLCFKSGNACILKGGSEADCSNRALAGIIRETLEQHAINPFTCTLLPPEREATDALMQAADSVDLLIPRGSSALIRHVREHARVPVIETGAGICHTYFDKDGDIEKGRAIVRNAKTRRVSVCNALDCLIIHQDRLADLPCICSLLADSRVLIFADGQAFDALSGQYPPSLLQPAVAESYGTEFLDFKMSVRTVPSLDKALEHIAACGSKHSECIVSESPEAIRLFALKVDAACVYANVSTAFTDGAQFGFGAEIGISTQKLHARGPMALPELTTYKYIIEGNGQTRN